MIQVDNKIKIKNNKENTSSLLGTYRLISYIIIPIVLFVIFFEKVLGIELYFIQKLLLIYTVSALLIFQFFSFSKFFKKNFYYAHFIFLSGVMLLNLFIYYENPGRIEGISLFMASNIIGIVIINPRATIWFYFCSLFLFVYLGYFYKFFEPEVIFQFLVGSIVISIFNYWRFNLYRNLQTARKTYQTIFDSSEQQVYVLTKELLIADLSIGAERYLNENNIKNFEDRSFTEIFIIEKGAINDPFKNAIEECERLGKSTFNANYSVGNPNLYIPKEFVIRPGKYFGVNVYLVNIRILKDQKDYENQLIRNKENITKVLNNIGSFVFNISFDEKERYKHHVNYVSQKVEDVYGYSMDEYIALVKTERISKDRHPDDKEIINKKFEKLLILGGKESWRFRMKVRREWRWIEEKIFIERTPETTIVSLFGIVKDVTDEVEARTKLKVSEKRYRQLFESNLAGVYKTHFDGSILDCNIAFAKILGYDSIEELLNIKIQDLYYSSHERQKYIELLLEKKAVNNHISIVKRKDGRRLVLNNNVSILKEKSKDYNIIVGTVIDVTELHETSIALKHSEEKYRLLFEESNNGILILYLDDKDSFIVDTNTQGVIMFGYPEKEIIGKKLEDISFYNNELDEQIENIYKELKTENKIELEWNFIKANGESFFAEVSFISVVLDTEKVAQIVIKDISERKRYEQEILESRLSFKNIVDQSPESILIFTNEKLVYLNPKGEDLYKNVLESKENKLFKIFPNKSTLLIIDLIKEADCDTSSYTEIDLGEENQKFSISVVKTIYNKKKSYVFILKDISLQNQYNIQKLRAELAEETNISLQEEIDNHKKTQQSLIESTSRLKALFESASSLFIFSLDKNYNIVSFNAKFKKGVKELLGKEVRLGQNFLEIFSPKKRGEKYIENKLNKVLKGETFEMVTNFTGLNGEVWMESFMNPIKIEEKEIEEISVIAHNITEQIENRKKVLQSEENNKAIILAVPDILFRVNNKGIFTDYRASDESNKKAFKKFISTTKIKGEKVLDVFLDKNIGKVILENVDRALKSNELITQNVSLLLDSSDSSTKIHYENRYSKIDDYEVVIISRNVTDTVENEKKLIESVKEKEILLKEVHHRVKNNLQVINSILNLQSSYVKDEETLQIIIESQNRIRSMAYIHESLYQTKNFSSIMFDEYITNLVQNLVHSYELRSDKTKLTLDIEKVKLPFDQAISCGLILNELITNSLKYAYPKKTGGELIISVRELKNSVHMIVKDFGVGLPEGFKIDESDSLGLSLVDTLIDQIDGELILKTEKGTEFLIIFEKQET